MADVKISALPAASTPLTGGEVLPVVQSGVTTKVAVSNLTAGLSGTASININGTVGATTPATGAFTSGTFSTTLGVTGAISFSSTLAGSVSTNATSPTTGAITTAGGVGIARDLYVGNIMFVGTDGVTNGIIRVTGVAQDMFLQTNATTRLSISNTGAVTIGGTLGVTGLITATTAGIAVPTSIAGTVYSGTWTPTITAISNVSASTAYVAQFTRVGNVVTGSAKFEIDPTTALTNTEFELSLPVASNFASNHQAAGSGALAAAGTAIFVLASVANDTLNCSYTPTSAANNSISITFSYLIV